MCETGLFSKMLHMSASMWLTSDPKFEESRSWLKFNTFKMATSTISISPKFKISKNKQIVEFPMPTRLSTQSGGDAIIAVGSTDAVRYGIGDGTLFLEYLGKIIGSLPINRVSD